MSVPSGKERSDLIEILRRSWYGIEDLKRVSHMLADALEALTEAEQRIEGCIASREFAKKLLAEKLGLEPDIRAIEFFAAQAVERIATLEQERTRWREDWITTNAALADTQNKLMAAQKVLAASLTEIASLEANLRAQIDGSLYGIAESECAIRSRDERIATLEDTVRRLSDSLVADAQLDEE